MVRNADKDRNPRRLIPDRFIIHLTITAFPCRLFLRRFCATNLDILSKKHAPILKLPFAPLKIADEVIYSIFKVFIVNSCVAKHIHRYLTYSPLKKWCNGKFGSSFCRCRTTVGSFPCIAFLRTCLTSFLKSRKRVGIEPRARRTSN